MDQKVFRLFAYENFHPQLKRCRPGDPNAFGHAPEMLLLQQKQNDEGQHGLTAGVV
jgi:hypothetical protein